MGQASRISGVNPADISILLVYIEQGKIARIEPINSKEILLDEHRTISIYARREGITLSSRQLEQFKIYFETLVEWNEKMNLTAITEKKKYI